MPTENTTRDDLIADLGAILSGIQVPRSLGMLGTATEPFDRVRRQLHLVGWPTDFEHTAALKKALDGSG